ncbi:hypothetical protein CEXT_328741, partial [Caerostris extrusa]
VLLSFIEFRRTRPPGNALGQIEPENLQDVRKLKVLKMSRCRLSEIHPIVYQQLPLLEN